MSYVREIGGEFWGIQHKTDERLFFLSGRTALEFIIRDIKKNKDIESVILPSWCCSTMIEPFARQNLQVRFYNVCFEQGIGLYAKKPEPRKKEIFYYMTYFGSCSIKGLSIDEVSQQWDCVVADETHSWLGVESFDSKQGKSADYRYISYRKWTGCYGVAVAIKSDGRFSIQKKRKQNEQYYSLRRDAMELKERYINGALGHKQDFLEKFAAAEERLDENYFMCAPCVEAVEQIYNLDKEYVKQKRRENADYLIEKLSDIREIQLVCGGLKEGEVPLFVPILVRSEERGALRKWLIDRDIYCPVHWPLSEYHAGLNDRLKAIYEMELSLLCDQRYGKEDMDRIADAIKEYYN